VSSVEIMPFDRQRAHGEYQEGDQRTYRGQQEDQVPPLQGIHASHPSSTLTKERQ
jgi:hypothetical protein